MFTAMPNYKVAAVHNDYQESLEELAEREMKLRAKFVEKMGIDPVDPKALFDMKLWKIASDFLGFRRDHGQRTGYFR